MTDGRLAVPWSGLECVEAGGTGGTGGGGGRGGGRREGTEAASLEARPVWLGPTISAVEYQCVVRGLAGRVPHYSVPPPPPTVCHVGGRQ